MTELWKFTVFDAVTSSFVFFEMRWDKKGWRSDPTGIAMRTFSGFSDLFKKAKAVGRSEKWNPTLG